jgi:hypothetical protein
MRRSPKYTLIVLRSDRMPPIAGNQESNPGIEIIKPAIPVAWLKNLLHNISREQITVVLPV